MDRTIKINDFPSLDYFTDDENFNVTIKQTNITDGVYAYKFSLTAKNFHAPKPVTVRWRLPSFNMKGVWKPGGVHDKRQQYDWELEHPSSRISVDAPVICIFGHNDQNVHSFACSDAINLIEMNALLREEDNHQYCHITFFKERHPAIKSYTAEIRIDTRTIPFYEVIQDVSKWWETFPALKPSAVPDIASAPLYSSWYSFHQNLEAAVLVEECKKAYEVGYELVILDDGWQTIDNNRGYDFTGDWKPERFPDMKAFVKSIKDTGMKFGLWYSVPFCGTKSEAYQKFKGKFLTEHHRWAPVFDPRYPEVRKYLIDIYVNALKDWDLDAFKLDFIDDFKVYPETVLTAENGRDFANVNEAVDRLLKDALDALTAINPNIGIEFRQQYVGPALRKYGNMFRAFDCPNDAVSNRIRITDVKMLCGNTAVHSDPQTWHINEAVEIAALQVLNGLFAVPQMSMELHKLPDNHFNMIQFYTRYWKENKNILLNGKFAPKGPLANYSILKASDDMLSIIGIYDDVVVDVYCKHSLDLINAKMTESVVIKNKEAFESECITFDCTGAITKKETIMIPQGIYEFSIPKSGMITIKKT